MNPKQLARIEELYNRALELEESERGVFLRNTCGGDDGLRREVESLLAAKEQVELESFMAQPANPEAVMNLTADSHESRIGQQVHTYKILSVLGAGGMGVVYRAHDLKLDRDVAIKFISGHALGGRVAGQRLLREARSAAALNHPNVCTIYEVGEAGGEAYIAMEYIDGQPLSGRIPGHGLQIEDLLRYSCQVVDALAHAHERGIVHRDLKPLNVLVTTHGRAKVLDFGLAKRVSGTAFSEATTQVESSITEPGILAGTLAYMAPEQLRGERASSRTDVWAMGVMLYEMATGRQPFAGKTPYELSSAILNQPCPMLPEKLPGALMTVIERCLQKDPQERYENADALKVALDGVNARLALWPFRRYRLSRRRLVSAALIVLVITIGLIWARLRGPSAGASIVGSIAVLPLENLSGDPQQEYFADGLTEEVITNLAKIQALKIISRTSVTRYKRTTKTPSDIARELNVDAIVEGSVQRSGNRVKVTAQLIRANTDRHLWANSYEREIEDVLKLESDIAAAIAGQVQVRVRAGESALLTSSRRVDPQAYEAYLRGRELVQNALNEETLRQGIDSLQRSLAIDSTYAPAHAALSYGYQFRAFAGYEAPATAMTNSRTEALDALRLDDQLSEAHANLYNVKFLYDWDWAGAEAELNRTAQLNPNSATAHQRRGEFFACIYQRFDESYQELKRARELDPYSGFIAQELAWNRSMARRWDEALRDQQTAMPLEPANPLLWSSLAQYHAHLNRRANALDALKRAETLAPTGTDLLFDEELIDAFAVLGMRREAEELLRPWIMKTNSGKYADAYMIAESYAALGEKESALRWLERAASDRSPELVFIRIDWAWDGLRSDARFHNILSRMKLSI
jgi:serine/threonine protein kinase